jgi:predicted nucleic acid-binding Zn ribbon protein
MRLIRDIAPRVVNELLRDQPLSTGKIRFAWQMSVGPSIARSTSVQLERDGTLLVTTSGEHWQREILRSAATIKQRLSELLGPHVVKRLKVKGRL